MDLNTSKIVLSASFATNSSQTLKRRNVLDSNLRDLYCSSNAQFVFRFPLLSNVREVDTQPMKSILDREQKNQTHLLLPCNSCIISAYEFHL